LELKFASLPIGFIITTDPLRKIKGLIV